MKRWPDVNISGIRRIPCRKLKIRGKTWKIVLQRPPLNMTDAVCHYGNRTIYIRPRVKNKFECVVHEILHVCLPDFEEEAIEEIEQAIISGLLLLPKIK